MLTGDQVDIGTVNELELMFDALDRVGLPAVQVNGNHEPQCYLDRDKIPSVRKEDLAPDEVVENFYSYFGPVRFAFFWGRYLFLVLDCMSSRTPQHQFWLVNLFDRIPAETPIVAAIHHPDMIYLFPELLERNLKLSVTGHYHTHQVFRENGVLNSSPGSALAVGVDGFPPGYRIYNMPDPDRGERIRYETFNSLNEPGLRKIMIKRVDWPSLSEHQDELQMSWSSPLDGAIKSSSPVLADGRVVVVPHDLDDEPVGRLQTFDLATGKLIWGRRLGDGFFGTPAVDEGLIYAQSLSGQVYCLSLENGCILWRTDLGPRGRRCCTGPVVIEKDFVLVGDSTYFAALVRVSGVEFWAWPEIRAGGAFYAAGTAVGDGVVLVGHAYDERGTIAVDVKSGKQRWTSGDRKHTRYSHCVFDRDFYFCGPSDVTCLQASTGNVKWMTPTDPWCHPEPLVHRGKVFVATSRPGLQALDRETGSELWRIEFRQPILPLAYNDTVAGGQLAAPVAYGDHVLVASNDGSLYAVDEKTGHIVWKHDFGIPLTSTPVVSGDHLVLATPDATLWKFKLPAFG